MSTYQKYANKLKSVIAHSTNTGRYETAFAAISAYCWLSYQWNQFYTDDEIEWAAQELSHKMLGDRTNSKRPYNAASNTVLFYDGFGLDTRGLALIYAKALIQLNYKVIWVTLQEANGNIPEIIEILESGNAEILYIDMKHSYQKHIMSLVDIFEKYMPSIAFFYTRPDDVSAAVTFVHYANLVKRFQINLTDHAFWLGTCAFDVCLEFREYGAGISAKYRKIPADKIQMLPYYPWVDKSAAFQGFPFEVADRKILFSGGALYKTIGGDNKYYRIISQALTDNSDLLFLYAGSGEDSEIKKLMDCFPNRVFHIVERKDLFALLENVDVYLNTYPMIGGLMTQYAAMAGKVPLILNDMHTDDASGILVNQKEAGIEFDSVEETVSEINKLLRDDHYRRMRGQQVQRGVITAEEFRTRLEKAIHETPEVKKWICPDTSKFLEDYKTRFTDEMIQFAIAKKKHKSLAKYFPELFVQKAFSKIAGILRKLK